MNLRLERRIYRQDGIFSDLKDESLDTIAVCLEHSYDRLPKIPNGVYTCKRGPHRLHGMSQDFITFEIMNVPGHSGVLFHVGNYAKDSEGCVLLGQKIASMPNGMKMITRSRDTFAQFMKLQEGLDEFQLVVCG